MKTAAIVFLALLLIPLNPVPARAQPVTGQADCRIDAGACTRAVGTLSVLFDITPKPVKVMREVTFTVTVQDGGRPVTDALLSVGLTMPGMYMGKNVVRLAHRGNGVYEGNGVIIRCPSGKKMWKASVSLQRGGAVKTASYIFEVQ